MRELFLSILLSISVITNAQDVIYTISGNYNGEKIPLDSIVVDNLTNGTSISFHNLPEHDYYQINLSKNSYWGTVNVFDLEKTPEFVAHQNTPGLLSVKFNGNYETMAQIAILNANGKNLFFKKNLLLLPQNLVQIKLGNTGIFFVRMELPDKTMTFKAIGFGNTNHYDVEVSEGRSNNKSSFSLKNATVVGDGDFTFQENDSIKIYAYKKDFFALPNNTRVKGSTTFDMSFQDVFYTSDIELAYPNVEGEEVKFTVDGDTLYCERINGEYIYQGDIVVNEDQINFDTNGASTDFIKLWPEGKVYYTIDESFTGFEDKLNRAIKNWNATAPIAFVERTNQSNYVEFRLNNSTTSSYLGMIGGKQIINLNEEANYGILMHEMAHAVGLTHEHDRLDRNEYINIDWTNIDPSHQKDFYRDHSSRIINFYDYNSLMSYGSYVSSAINANQAVLTKKAPEGEEWNAQRSYLSRNDIKLLEELYGIQVSKKPRIELYKFDSNNSYSFDRNNLSVEIGAHVISTGETAILEKGIGLIKSGDKTVNYFPSDNTSDTFIENISGIEPCTEYYYFAYAKNSYGIKTSEYRRFKTPINTAKTVGASDVTMHSVVLQGELIQGCNNNEISHGGFIFCDENGNNPGQEFSLELNADTFSVKVEHLASDSTYYFKAYILDVEQVFGEVMSFTTLKEPIFNYPPVELSKVEFILPMGGMSGNHVTPIDHQYYVSPDFGPNESIQIDVYSPDDGTIVSMQHMGNFNNNDYRFVIQHTETLTSIYIHVDNLSPKLAQYAPVDGNYVNTNIPVSAGEILGNYVGSVDYNLVDNTVTLEGYVNLESYVAEPWKIHTVDPFPYFKDSIENMLIAKSLRTVPPVAGKIDHDIDGRLVGNWFLENTNGYAGIDQSNYWIGHLAFAYDYIVPSHVIASFGNYNGEPRQFGVAGNSPDPADVSQSSGLVKYELVQYDYYNGDTQWDRKSLVKGLTMDNYPTVYGVLLVQLVEDRKLKMEIFYNQTANEVEGFTSEALYYVR